MAIAQYWTASDLAQFFPEPVPGTPLITATSYPVNMNGLATYIYLVGGQLNAAIQKAGYEIPVPSWDPVASAAIGGYAYVQEVARWGVMAAVMEQVYVGPNDEGKRWRTLFDKAIDDIRNGNQQIPDAPIDFDQQGRLLPSWFPNPDPQIRSQDLDPVTDTVNPLW